MLDNLLAVIFQNVTDCSTLINFIVINILYQGFLIALPNYVHKQ